MSCNVTLIGMAGKDAETKSYQGDKKMVVFSLADSYGRGDQKKTSWYDVKVWDDPSWVRLEAMNVKKGDRVVVVGTLEVNKTNGPNGERTYVQITARQVGVLKKFAKEDIGATANQSVPGGEAGDDEDIPF